MVDKVSQSPRDLEGWLAYLHDIHPVEIDLSLERIQSVFARLDIVFTGKVVTIAGTNGKGSTGAAIEQMALYQDRSVGVYSSPHLLDYRERVRVNGHKVSEELHCQAFARVEAARLAGAEAISLTFFEMATLAALCLLADAALDLIILEAGLGGRNDAVNVVAPDIAVITSIGLDHQEWLGDTREQVAVHKAGIVREGGVAVIGDTEPPQTLIDEVARLQVDAKWQNKDFQMLQNELNCWEWHFGEQHLGGMPQPSIPRMNIGTALATASLLGWQLDNSLAQHVCRNTHLPGRFQIVQQVPYTVLDVAHNQQATEYLRYKLKDKCRGNLHLVVGMLSDKDSTSSLAPFIELGAHWYFAPLPTGRSADPDVLIAALPESEKSAKFDTVSAAFDKAQQAAFDDDCILVFGSFFTVAEVLKQLQN